MFRRKPKIYGADVVHREYISDLYERLNKKLTKRYKRGSIFEELTVEDIELFARRTEDNYEAIGNVMIARIEELLSAKLPYQDRAAIIIRQAEYVFDRPMFRKERGHMLSREYEKDFGRYNNPYIAGYFVGEWSSQRCLARDESNNWVEFTKKRESVPILAGHHKYSFFNLGSPWFLPPIWITAYPMNPTPGGGVAFDSDHARPVGSWCEFPPGVTIEEMEKLFSLQEKQVSKDEEGKESFLQLAKEMRQYPSAQEE